jgi:predicted nucleotidyltransferase
MTLEIDVTPYLAHARRRAARQRRETEARYNRAWELARQAAALLKSRFGARRVVLFGSLLNKKRFRRWSDVDLAAWGLPGITYYKAQSALLDLDPTISIDLVDPENCSPNLCKIIAQEGMELC